VARTKEFYEEAFGLLQKLDFNPRPGHDLTKRRFCRLP